MNASLPAPCRLAAVALAAAVLLPAGPAAAADAYKLQTGDPSGTYRIDPHHSLAEFWVGHLGVSELPGRFDRIEGTFTFDAKHPERDKVSVTIPVKSLDTNDAQRDKDLLGPDFFDAKAYPTMKFTSTSVKWDNKHHGTLTGKLTLKGVTRTVHFDLHHIGAGPDPWGGYRSGYVADAAIKRSDFAMSYMQKGISDMVQLQLNIEGKREKKQDQ